MKKEVCLKIKGIQRYPGEEAVETVTEADAEYFLRNQSRYVMFEEKQEGFSETVKGMLKIKKDCIELTKKGLIQSHMVFERGNLHMTDYRTPFGGFLLGVRTKTLQIQDLGNEIGIDIAYELESEERMMADCTIQITIRENK